MKTCPWCKGSGECFDGPWSDDVDEIDLRFIDCDVCDGKGKVADDFDPEPLYELGLERHVKEEP